MKIQIKAISLCQVMVFPFIWLTMMALVSCEFFSSVHELTKLVDYEKFLLAKMEKFITFNENKLDYLKEKLSLFQRMQEDSLKESEVSAEYYKKPINIYFLMKRLSLDWEKLQNLMENNVGINILKNIDKFKDNYTPSGEHDYEGAIEGVLRLQHVYRLSTKDMSHGILGGIKYKISEFSAKDCFDFGRVAMKTEHLLLAHAWLTEAQRRIKGYEPTFLDVKIQITDVLELLAEVKFKLGDYKGAVDISQELMVMLPNHSRILDQHHNYTQYHLSSDSKEVVNEHEPIPENLNTIDPIKLAPGLAYRLTCSGHINPLPSYERNLHCGYLTETHPFLLLAPLKVEELHWDPLLVLYHDVIYDSEIEKLIQLASDKIQRAMVSSVNGSEISNVRTSQNVFLNKETDRILGIIDERTADMTGLNMDAAEDHQVANYGIGGHYAQHFDFFVRKKDNKGNRIATVLFYLSDVEQGGATAFPLMRRLVKPKKGAAAFWYNLRASGDGDKQSQHGACPVLVGSKWVLNRWIREKGQEFKRPCELENDSNSMSMKFE